MSTRCGVASSTPSSGRCCAITSWSRSSCASSPPENEDDDARVWIELVAVDESFQAPVVELRDQPVDPVDAAAWLYDALWDWLVETRFAWGQDRSGEYRVPPSSTV